MNATIPTPENPPLSELNDFDIFIGPAQLRALRYLQKSIDNKNRISLLTGVQGTGKTTLLHHLVTRQTSELSAIYIDTNDNTSLDLLESVSQSLDIAFNPELEFKDVILRIYLKLLNAATKRKHFALILDHADFISEANFNFLIGVSQLKSKDGPLLPLIICGRRFQNPKLNRISNSIGGSKSAETSHHLQPLVLRETKQYLRFQLAKMGSSTKFNYFANRKIQRYTKGIPGEINNLVTKVLAESNKLGKNNVTATIVSRVFRNLPLSQFGFTTTTAIASALILALVLPLKMFNNDAPDLSSDSISSLGAAADKITQTNDTIVESEGVFPETAVSSATGTDFSISQVVISDKSLETSNIANVVQVKKPSLSLANVETTPELPVMLNTSNTVNSVSSSVLKSPTPSENLASSSNITNVNLKAVLLSSVILDTSRDIPEFPIYSTSTKDLIKIQLAKSTDFLIDNSFEQNIPEFPISSKSEENFYDDLFKKL